MAGLDSRTPHLLPGIVWPNLGAAAPALPPQDADDSHADGTLCVAPKSNLCQQHSDECGVDGGLQSLVDGSNNRSLVCGDFHSSRARRGEEDLEGVRAALLGLPYRGTSVDTARG